MSTTMKRFYGVYGLVQEMDLEQVLTFARFTYLLIQFYKLFCLALMMEGCFGVAVLGVWYSLFISILLGLPRWCDRFRVIYPPINPKFRSGGMVCGAGTPFDTVSFYGSISALLVVLAE